MPKLKFGLFSKLKTFKGFSLIEVLVAIAILGIVVALAMPNVKKFTEDQEAVNIASDIANTLKTAQSNAQSGVVCPDSAETIDNWAVVVNSPSSYQLNANCTIPHNLYTNSVAGVTITVPDCTANPQISFKGNSVIFPSGGCTFTDGIFTISVEGNNGKQVDIHVSKGGNIY